ncbi:MAG TPA: hypothetical protein VH083_21910 [Myxococcales bacterium]|nr:hypothetical protein [Myxococcales bacterium]
MKAFFLALLLAYIPSPTSLLRSSVVRGRLLGRTKEVTMTGTLTAAGAAPKQGTLTMHFPASCKLEAESVSFSVKGTAAEGTAGPVLKLLQQACPLLTLRGLNMAEALGTIRAVTSNAGVELSAGVSLQRLGDRVAYVLGAPTRDPARPQLWLYKDNRAPARLIAQGGTDLRLLQYGDPAAADWFPRVMELWQDGQLQARFEVLETRGVRQASEDEEDE